MSCLATCRSTAVKARLYPGESEVDRVMDTGGFQSAAHFYHAIYKHGMDSREQWVTEGISRWNDAVKAVASTVDDPSAGVLIPEAFSTTIEKRMLEKQNLIARARTVPVPSGRMQFHRRKDASRVAGSRHAGLTVRYEGEGATATATRASFEDYWVEAHKLLATVELTDEMLTGAAPVAMEAEMTDLAAEAVAYKSSDMMVNGTGAGMPFGILAGTTTATTGCRIVVSKETNQAAATLDAQNINKMWMRLDPELRRDAIWMVNNDTSVELDNIAFPMAAGGAPSYVPAGSGSNDSGYALLKGRPVIPFEFCQTLGTEGDIILAAWSAYRCITRSGLRTDLSAHIYFDRDSYCFRISYRHGGTPIWHVPFTPARGTTTTSPFVSLETRA